MAGVAAEAGELDDWQQIRRLLEDGNDRSRLFLDVFETAYGIHNCSDALLHVQDFLGRFLVKDFDHEGFQEILGSEEGVDADLTAASSLALRMTMMIAKHHGLRQRDFQELSQACGKAIRSLPACYRLQRLLPGALNDARALRILQGSEEELGRLNPWQSQEGQELFESRHGVAWADMKALTAKDGSSLGSFHGPFMVQDVVTMPALSIVHLKALSSSDHVEEGDVVLWEVDGGLGSLLQEGFVLVAHWRLMESEFCFMCELDCIYPDWAMPKTAVKDS